MNFDVMQWIRKVKVDSWQHMMEMEQNKIKKKQRKIEMELQKGVWCGYQSSWSKSNSEISYWKLLHASTNMKNPGIGLDTQSGEFTVPVTGVWRVSFSLQSGVDTGQYNRVYIYHNQQQIEETRHETYSDNKGGYVESTGGRVLITRAERGDTFHLGTGSMNNSFYRIITCFEFVSL